MVELSQLMEGLFQPDNRSYPINGGLFSPNSKFIYSNVSLFQLMVILFSVNDHLLIYDEFILTNDPIE